MKYAHTLLFVCPDCNLPVSTSKISEEKNLEDMESATIGIKCDYCEHASSLLAVTAKMHWVTEWEDSREASETRASTRAQ
jgi:hypothetical protein